MIPLKVQRARKRFVTAVLRTAGRTVRIRMRMVMLALCRLTGKQGPTGAAPKWRWLSITLSKEPWFCPFSAGLVLLAALFWPWKIPPHSQPLYFDDGHHWLLCGSPWIYKFINYLTFSGMQYSVRTYPFFSPGLLISHKNRAMHFCYASEFIRVFKFMCLSFSRKLWLRFFLEAIFHGLSFHFA